MELCYFFYLDQLGSSAFSVVQNDMNGNIKVKNYIVCLWLLLKVNKKNNKGEWVSESVINMYYFIIITFLENPWQVA